MAGPRGVAVSWAEAGKGPQAAGGSAARGPARVCSGAKEEGWDFILRVMEVTGVFQREITRCIDQSKLQLQRVLFGREGIRWNKSLALEF